MNLFRLALRNIEGSALRSWIVFTAAVLVAGFAVSATAVIRGAQKSLNLTVQRLGADILVVPAGVERNMENAFLMGVPMSAWMPQTVAAEVAEVAGVAAVSPQFFLSTLRGATCCSLPEMFLIAYDPATDFTLRPWLESHQAQGLARNDAVGGSLVFVPADQENILIYGTPVNLVGNLTGTGTGLDQSMFLTFETAREIARQSPELAEKPLVIPDDSISAALVKIERDADPQTVAAAIAARVPGVTPVVSTNLFRTHRQQIDGLLKSVIVLLGISWLLALGLIAVVFSIVANERQREIGVLRALGATRPEVLRTMLAEGLALALAGGSVGTALAYLVIYLFRNLIVQSLGVPFIFPSLAAMVGIGAVGLGLALVSVLLAAFFPTWRIATLDPVTAMRD